MEQGGKYERKIHEKDQKVTEMKSIIVSAI